jgi:hypothetical protein
MSTFLNNNSDIVLDAVLTDYGRLLLARGDGSFNIVKFALGDDEIDYSLYQEGVESARKDELIMATPILEAFTNNAASLKSKLLTIASKNLLFLPILKLNAASGGDRPNDTAAFFGSAFTGFAVPVNRSDLNTTAALTVSLGNKTSGILTSGQNYVRVDQGLDSSKSDRTVSLASMPDLYEREYNVFIDNRFGALTLPDGTPAPVDPVIDDDQIAMYKFTLDGTGDFVKQMKVYNSDTSLNENPDSVIQGSRGTKLEFSIKAKMDLVNNSTHFDKYGKSVTSWASRSYVYIPTHVKVVGATTGYSIDIPVAFVKYVP